MLTKLSLPNINVKLWAKEISERSLKIYSAKILMICPYHYITTGLYQSTISSGNH